MVTLAEADELAGDEVLPAEDEEEAEEVSFPLEAPGRPSNETSLARSPHLASRARSISSSLGSCTGLERTYPRRMAEYRSSRSSCASVSTIQTELTRRNSVGRQWQTAQLSRSSRSRSCSHQSYPRNRGQLTKRSYKRNYRPLPSSPTDIRSILR